MKRKMLQPLIQQYRQQNKVSRGIKSHQMAVYLGFSLCPVS